MSESPIDLIGGEENIYYYSIAAGAIGFITELVSNSSFLAYLYGVPTADIKYVQNGYYSVDTTFYLVDAFADMVAPVLRGLLLVVGIDSMYKLLGDLNQS